MKKSLVTRELVNLFPPNSKVRTSDQSIGFQFLNTVGSSLEKMDKQLEKMRYNQYLSTVNLDEIDLTYRVDLPTTFTFGTDNTDPLSPSYLAPTVQGLVINTLMSGYVDIELVQSNNIKDFWYESVPNRALLETTASGDFVLLNQDAVDFPWSGNLQHHLKDEQNGGRVWVETVGGVQYVKQNERGEVDRGEIVLYGTTRKGTKESELLVFPWDEKKPSLKEWKSLDAIDVFNIESGVNIEVRSADFNQSPYWSFWNLRWSDNRTKIDEFWGLGTMEDGTQSTIERIGFISDEWQQVMLGFSDKEEKQSWELLDESWQPVTAVDMAIQPFTDRAWLVTQSGILYCYSLDEIMFSGVRDLQTRTAGPDTELDIDSTHLNIGDTISITPWHARPVKEITRFRVWYKDPSGTKYGLLNGSPVSFTSDFWVFSETLKRSITDTIELTAAQRGEYLFVLETEFVDSTSQIDRAIVQVEYKLPLTTIDLTDLVSEPIVGIDFDSDQKLWVRTATKYYQISLFSDVMLIDYTQKTIYCREQYRDVKVTI